MRSGSFSNIPDFSDSSAAGEELHDRTPSGLNCGMNRREFVAGAGVLTGAAAFGFTSVQSGASSIGQIVGALGVSGDTSCADQKPT